MQSFCNLAAGINSFVTYSPVGCHVIAPSDMMDNRIAAIKDILHRMGYGGKVSYNTTTTNFCFLLTDDYEMKRQVNLKST